MNLTFTDNKIFKISGTITSEIEFKNFDKLIEIENGEEITLDFTELTFSEGELQKIVVDWDDGDKSSVIKYESVINDSLNSSKWKILTHKFNVKNKNIFDVHDNFLPKIKILLYSSHGQTVRIIASYKIEFKPLGDLCNFTLISSHTSNDNLTSFVLKESYGDSIIIVQEKDWRKVYVDDQVIYKQITFTETNVDDYISDDDTIWDWNVLPQINMVVKNDDSTIYCEFVEKNISIDKWDGNIHQIKDDSDVKLEIQMNENEYKFQGDYTDGGIYSIQVNYTGINDLSNTTTKYVAIPSDYNPSSVSLSFYTDTHDKIIQFSHSDYMFFHYKHIKECILTFFPQKVDNSPNGMNFNESQWQDVSTLNPKSVKMSIDNFTNYSIPLKSLPNGRYNVKSVVKDVLGNKTESNYSLKWIYENVYAPKSQNITTNDKGLITFSIEDESLVDDIEISLENGNGTYSISKPLNAYKDNETQNYKFTIPPYEVENGNYTLTISNILYTSNPINNIGEYRKKGVSMSYKYNYSFDIISSFEPFIRYEGDEIKAFVNYNLDLGDAKANEITLNINSESFEMPVEKPQCTLLLLSDTNNTITQVIKLGNRTTSEIHTIEVSSLDELKESIIDYKSLDSEDLDYIKNDNEYLKIEEDDAKLISGSDVINESLLDIHKIGYYENNNDIFYLTDKDNVFKVDGKQLYTYYKLNLYTDVIGEKVYKRYSPVNRSSKLSKNNNVENFPIDSVIIEELPKIEDNESDEPIPMRYDQDSNTSQFKISLDDTINIDDVLYGIVKLTDVQKENEFFYYDIKNETNSFTQSMQNVSYDKSNNLISNIPLGKYQIDLTFSSIDKNKATETRYSKENPINLYALSNYIISVSVECYKDEITNKNVLKLLWSSYYPNIIHSDLSFYYVIRTTKPSSTTKFTKYDGDIWANYDGSTYSFIVDNDVNVSGSYEMYYYFQLKDNYFDIEYDAKNIIEIIKNKDQEDEYTEIYRQIPYKLNGTDKYDSATISLYEDEE